jgi:hypothetical protein
MKKKTPPLNEKNEIQQYCYASHFLKGERKTGSDWWFLLKHQEDT